MSSDQGAPRRFGRRTIVLAAAAVAVLVLVSGLVALAWPGGKHGPTAEPKPSEAVSDNPLHGVKFYVDPQGHAAQQVRVWRAEDETTDATALARLANQPVAKWLGQNEIAAPVAALTSAAEAAGRQPLIVAYNIPHRDCGQYSSGGAENAAEYRRWIDGLAQALTAHAATVILEPDAVAHTLDGCLDASQASERYGLLKYAVTTLTANPKVTVYVDAGNASWIKDVSKVVHALSQVGIARADGFALNVSNFETTAKTAGYGRALSDRLGGKHFVIDTSRNGNGPYQQGDADLRWCNPPGRALGAAPTTDTGIQRVDAFLWIKQPGDSDGACREGAPAAGQWWPEYALDLAKSGS